MKFRTMGELYDALANIAKLEKALADAEYDYQHDDMLCVEYLIEKRDDAQTRLSIARAELVHGSLS